MKKFIAILCLVVFVQFTSVYAFSPELMLKSFNLDKASTSQDEGTPFSLKTSYSPKLKFENPSSLSLAQGAGTPEEEIQKLKSRRTMNYVGAVAFIGIGAGLIYLFATYESGSTTNQLGEQIGHTETNSFTQWGYLLGAILCGGISAYLISSGVKNGKAIKEYEAELKAAAAVTRR